MTNRSILGIVALAGLIGCSPKSEISNHENSTNNINSNYQSTNLVINPDYSKLPIPVFHEPNKYNSLDTNFLYTGSTRGVDLIIDDSIYEIDVTKVNPEIKTYPPKNVLSINTIDNTNNLRLGFDYFCNPGWVKDITLTIVDTDETLTNRISRVSTTNYTSNSFFVNSSNISSSFLPIYNNLPLVPGHLYFATANLNYKNGRVSPHTEPGIGIIFDPKLKPMKVEDYSTNQDLLFEAERFLKGGKKDDWPIIKDEDIIIKPETNPFVKPGKVNNRA